MAESGDDKKQSFTGLAAKLGRLPADKRRVALEVSAALAAISLRVSREFVEAVPHAADILSADDLRNWGELGRRLAMGSAGTGVSFFSSGVEGLEQIPEGSRSLVFQICTRQLVLSSSIALETFGRMPALSAAVNDPELLRQILELALEIANRSAKHSSDFLIRTPAVAEALNLFGDAKLKVAGPVIRLASTFAGRTGGMTADLWSNLPSALEGLSPVNAVKLAETASEFLEFGGSVTLHFISSGSSVLLNAPDAFDDWSAVLRKIAKQGNAVLIAFLRSTPKFFKHPGTDVTALRRVLQLAGEIAETDAESALAAFRSSGPALRRVTLGQFEKWIETGMRETSGDSPKGRRSYFALETRQSNAILQNTRAGLHLEDIHTILRVYIEGLTGKTVEIAALSNIPQESRIGDGKTISLPSSIAEFDDEDQDFRLYKVLAAHGAGQIEFGTFEKDTTSLRAAYKDLSSLYEATAEQRDAFSLGGYLGEVEDGDQDSPPSEGGVEVADGVVHPDLGFRNSDLGFEDHEIRNPQSEIPNQMDHPALAEPRA
ncbi:MAG TPA: hypothetical protein VNA22_01535, partial [Pyrinomonadaceae bacterium]|nr:hypothetical protein [Pyrinomonadaceae bacterium]